MNEFVRRHEIKYQHEKSILHGSGNESNVFLNKELFSTHFSKKYRKRRIEDFKQIYAKLKSHLQPTNKITIDKKLEERYIKMYKKENQKLIQKILDNLHHITFKQFMIELEKQIIRFNNYLKDNNIKKYIFVIGVTSDIGGSITDFNIYKSNLWVFMLGWKYLAIKPHDIVLNLNIAIRLYLDSITDFLMMDDCSYSGIQLIDFVLKPASTELLYQKENGYEILEPKMNSYAPIFNKYCNIHLIIPYISNIAIEKLCQIKQITGFNIIGYHSLIIKAYGDILDEDEIIRINDMYQKFLSYGDFSKLIPIIFDHKIADSTSTIELIIIKGQVLDNFDKRLVFVKECQYDKNDPEKKEFDPSQKNFIHKKIYCPIPPYLNFEKYLR